MMPAGEWASRQPRSGSDEKDRVRGTCGFEAASRLIAAMRPLCGAQVCNANVFIEKQMSCLAQYLTRSAAVMAPL